MFSTSPARSRRKRVQRSELAVPATSERFFRKAIESDVDFVFLDLEDAIAPERKQDARELAIKALNELDWRDKVMSVRINSLDSEWGVRDLIEVVSRAPRLDLVLLPKVGNVFDVQFADALIGSLERELGRKDPLGLECLIETTLGLANVEQIAASSPRLEAMIFGIGDYSIDLGTCGEIIGASDPRYAVELDGPAGRTRHASDQWHFALARMANACRAHGLRAIDGPYANFRDVAGYTNSAERAAAIGCEGKWAIHIDQVPHANAVFTPDVERVAWAKEILAEIEAVNAKGDGAYGRNGVLIDMAVEKIARSVIDRVQEIEGRRR